MFKKFTNIFDNKFILIAGLLALFLSPIADAIGGSSAWVLFFILFPLFLYGLFDEKRRHDKFEEDIVHIPLVINVEGETDSSHVMEDMIQKIEDCYRYTDYKRDLDKYLNINTDNLIFNYKGDIFDFNRVMSFARIIKYKKNQLEVRLNKRVKYHIAYYKRPSIAYLIGVMFRTDGISVYQNNDAENNFLKVSDISSRKYKEKVHSLKKYEVIENLNDENKDHILVTIRSSSHNININSNELKKFKNRIYIELLEGNTIPYETDWTVYCAEIYNVINDLQTKYNSITIAHAMPEALALMLGMALENYWNITITQYNHKTSDYPKILVMNQIEYYD